MMSLFSRLLGFNYGIVLAVNGAAVDSNGNPVPTVLLKSAFDGATQVLPMNPPAFFQVAPMPGYAALWMREGRYAGRIICYWGANENFIRKGIFGLNAGEVQIQSPSGLAYLKLDELGQIWLVSGDTLHQLTFSPSGANILSQLAISLTVKNTNFTLGQDSSAAITRLDQNGKSLSSFSLDSQDNLNVVVNGDVNIKASGSINLDGKVKLGPGASDPNQDSIFQGIVSGAPSGTFPTDPETGAPIPGSSTVRVSA